MVHFTQSLLPDVPLASSLPTTFTFNPNNQIDEQSTHQQAESSSHQQQQQSSPSHEDRNSNSNPQTHMNDYETRLRCPNCETWVVNLSDHLRKTHRIASPVDRKPLLRMARLEKRRMAESANQSSPTPQNTTTLKTTSSSTLILNGITTGHANSGHEIENLLFKHEPQTPATNSFSVTLPENILLNQQMTNNPLSMYSTSTKRSHTLDDQLESNSNGMLPVHKKVRLDTMDTTKTSQVMLDLTAKSNKKNRNKQTTTMGKPAVATAFPSQMVQQTMTIQNISDSADDLSKVLQMMGNEMNFLNQHLQTTSVLLQKQLDLARDSLHAFSVQFGHLKRMIQQ